MTRPALVIGIGGTGQWVLTHLKKDLIESNSGVMPNNVRLLCFDTLPQAGAKIAGASSTANSEDKEVKLGSIRLTDKEFVHLGGKVYALSQVVAKDEHKRDWHETLDLPHLTSWYKAGYWLKNLPEAAFNLDEGAGMLRQFGRMALFHDLENPLQSKLLSSIKTAIDDLNAIRKGQPIEIIIAGSFAGGTGSGLFIDMALLIRHISAMGVPKLLRGYLVLPRAFTNDAGNNDMLARTFAAWRELNRFMVVSSDFSVPRITYNSSEQAGVEIKEINTKLFDACYLVDGIRGNTAIAAEAELGTHPTIAAAISAILDEKAGAKYTEWAANLAFDYAARLNQGVPLYSAVGTYTYKVPVYYAQQDFAHKFTINWLNRLLRPIYDDPQNRDRISRVDSTNPDDPSKTGRNDAMTLLTSPREYAGRNEAPTTFYSVLASLVSAADNTKFVEAYARGAAAGGAGQTWLQSFTDLKDRQDIAQVVEIVKKEATIKLKEAIGETEKTEQFPAHARAILQKFIPAHYGFVGTQGQEVRGSFGAALDKCADAQVGIFKRLSELWLLKTLMSGDKSGRLGYALDLLDGLVDRFKEFDTFMDKVGKRRQEVKPYLEASNKRAVSLREMEDYCSKWIVFGLVPHPKRKDSIEAYLKREQDVVDARRDEILHGSVTQTVRHMRQITENLRNEVARWVRLLATGDPATGVTGLYSQLDKQRRALEEARKADEAMTSVQVRLGDLDYPQDQEVKELTRLLDGIKWELLDGKLQFSISPQGETPVKLELPSSRENADMYANLTQRNLSAMQGYAYKRFGQLPQETRIAEQLRGVYTPESWAKDVDGKAEPLFERQPGKLGGQAKLSELIRIGNDKSLSLQERNFVEQMERERRKLRKQSETQRNDKNLIEVVGSDDPHKCTIVRTDDLIPVEFFKAWTQCQTAYLTNNRFTPELNHNFPAEANAAKYEKKFAGKRERDYRVFHPWVVMLMENTEALEQFFICKTLNWISIKQDGGTTHYELRIPGQPVLRLTPSSKSLYSLFQAARYFVLEGKDQTSGANRRIHPEVLNTAFEKHEQTVGTEEWMSLLIRHSGSKTSDGSWIDGQFAAELMKHVDDLKDRQSNNSELPTGEPANYEKAYRDLADVATLMFEERKERKEIQARQMAAGRPLPPAPVA